jgi:hypothetical protein
MKWRRQLLALGVLVTPWAQGQSLCEASIGERLVEWPAQNPIWRLCAVNPRNSSGPRGSGLEIRNVHYKDIQVFKRAHAPVLFAEYRGGAGGNCYRDWKDENSRFIAPKNAGGTPVLGELVRTTSSTGAITSCDRSNHPTNSFGNCHFSLSGYSSADCRPNTPTSTTEPAVAFEDRGDRLILTTQYVAGWYLYSMRWILHRNGRIEPVFGFGNSNGTYNTVTHWHHNYWRWDFDINGAGADTLYTNGVAQSVEFSGLRTPTSFWEVIDDVTGQGYRITPGSGDFQSATNESGRNFHTVDVLGTTFVNNEFSDRPTNNLNDCTFLQDNLVNGGSVAGTDVVFYYRGGVRDATANDWPTPSNPIPQDSMVCKSVNPVLTPVGPWPLTDGFESADPP